MNINRTGYSFAVLGWVSLAGGMACLGWAHWLGGYGFVGATVAAFLAMLSFTRFATLRRPLAGAARSVPGPESVYASIRAALTPSRPNDDEDDEDARIDARLEALRVAAQQFKERPIAAPEPEPAVVVVEGASLEPELVSLFAEASAPAAVRR